MNEWKQRAPRLLVVGAVVAGGYLCSVGAHDHAASAAGVAARDATVHPSGVEPPAVTCARDGAGITCTEEIAVTAPRRTPRPVLVAERGTTPERALTR